MEPVQNPGTQSSHRLQHTHQQKTENRIAWRPSRTGNNLWGGYYTYFSAAAQASAKRKRPRRDHSRRGPGLRVSFEPAVRTTDARQTQPGAEPHTSSRPKTIRE